MPGQQDMPSTIRKSDARAQDIYVKTHDAAVEQYGEGERAHRTAFASLKYSIGNRATTGCRRDTAAPRTRKRRAIGSPTA